MQVFDLRSLEDIFEIPPFILFKHPVKLFMPIFTFGCFNKEPEMSLGRIFPNYPRYFTLLEYSLWSIQQQTSKISGNLNHAEH